jgi:hypothetical protein
MRSQSASSLQAALPYVQPGTDASARWSLQQQQQQWTGFNAGNGESFQCQIEMDTPRLRPAVTSV